MNEIRIWDPFLRICHWLLALLFVLNYWVLEGGETVHEWAGCSLAGIVVVRVVWGFVGPVNARFRNFYPTPSRLRNYFRNPADRYRPEAGHNPLGGLMILFLLFMLLATATTGWMQELDRFWGEEWVQNFHECLSRLLLGAVILHIVAVFVIQKKIGISLVVPMITGKRKIL